MNDEVVVVGVDGSTASYAALRWAMAQAGQHTGGQVRAVRCWQPLSATRWKGTVTGERVPPIAEQQSRAQRELAQIVTAALVRSPDAVKVTVRRRVARGPAGRVLVSEAVGAALLVVGSHGHRRINDPVGSTTSHCVRHATCPVVVIPPTMATRRPLGATSRTRPEISAGLPTTTGATTHTAGYRCAADDLSLRQPQDADVRRHLPEAYLLALRLREAGLADALIAECLAVEREALNPLLDVAEAKLATIVGAEQGE